MDLKELEMTWRSIIVCGSWRWDEMGYGIYGSYCRRNVEMTNTMDSKLLTSNIDTRWYKQVRSLFLVSLSLKHTPPNIAAWICAHILRWEDLGSKAISIIQYFNICNGHIEIIEPPSSNRNHRIPMIHLKYTIWLFSIAMENHNF